MPNTNLRTPLHIGDEMTDVYRERGWIEAIALIKQDKPFTLQVIRKYLATDDAEAVESGYETFGTDYLVRAPYPTRAAFQSILDFVAEKTAK